MRRSAAPGWAAEVERLLRDDDADVRAAAVQAVAALRREDIASSMQRYLDDPEPRIAATAAVVLADAGRASDAAAAEATLMALAGDLRETAVNTRREVAAALAHVKNPRFARCWCRSSPSGRDVRRAAIRRAARPWASSTRSSSRAWCRCSATAG